MSGVRSFAAEVLPDWDAMAPVWRSCAGEPASPFQTEAWLRSWYATVGAEPGCRPLPVAIREAGDGRIAALFPLVRMKRQGRPIISFADGGITDYNAPLLGPAAPDDATGALALWTALRTALPPADLALFEKLLPVVDGRPNPLVLALRSTPSNLFGNLVEIEGGWDAWRFGLERTFRKELERSWRVFERRPGTAFVRATTVDQGLALHAKLEAQQGARIRALGLPYRLDEPAYAAHYRDMVAAGLDDGSVILTALMAGEELVAGLYGVADDRHYAMVRISAAGEGWSNCSPGRLVIERTLYHLYHTEGRRSFDFTIGDYAHKRGFQAVHVNLVDITVGLSWRGLPHVGLQRAKSFVKERPALAGMIRRVMARAA